MDANEAVAFPEDLTGLNAEQLRSLHAAALSEFNTITDTSDDDITDAQVDRLEVLAAGIETLQAALQVSADGMLAEENVTKRRKRRDQVALRVRGEGEVSSAGAESPAAAAAVGSTQVAARPRGRLADAQQLAPAQPQSTVGAELAISAASPTASISIGQKFSTMDDLVAAVGSHAKGMVTSHGNPSFLTVATIQNDFEFTVHGERTSPAEFETMVRELRHPEVLDDIVAGGGWCSPSQLRYDFFNIACEDGAVDLPTFGVQRGGIRYPISPSLADVFTGSFTNATNPWLWTETDDIATVTGAPNKPCVRVLCPTFDEERLECYGICLTAGNLTDSAYPEATRNHLALLMSAHFHAINLRYLTRMESLSTSPITVTGTGSILADLPDKVAVAANDIRARFGMCDDDVLEVIIPRWARDAMRGDHLRRTGFWESPLTNAEIDALFRVRRTRIQWVADWQTRGAGQLGQATPLNGWPSTVDFMIYPAGTFLRGSGMTLDLGIVRDSVLNAENDHTAAWSEECHLIMKFGHESRRYRVPVCVAGRTGANDITNCALTV